MMIVNIASIHPAGQDVVEMDGERATKNVMMEMKRILMITVIMIARKYHMRLLIKNRDQRVTRLN